MGNKSKRLKISIVIVILLFVLSIVASFVLYLVAPTQQRSNNDHQGIIDMENQIENDFVDGVDEPVV